MIPTRLWTRKCKGNCRHQGPHTHHMTWLGWLALRLKASGASQPFESSAKPGITTGTTQQSTVDSRTGWRK